MNRITEITIGGKAYPLNFSVRAAKQATERYGDLSEVSKALIGVDKKYNPVDETVWLLETMLAEGARYVKLVDGSEITTPTAEDLETLVGYYDVELREKLMAALFGGMETEIETEDSPKNAGPTQSE
ncbi:hypothetical protein [Anaerotruncus massiliensis (ex Liu et al. 2021)]|jgi:hypothetical protein|uniref:hypothetical protein n=1 Tax=Anaerotruncus massiliensis (ex Liu et al. 2021) TaxID=2321404 RepID=UPI003AB1AEC9